MADDQDAVSKARLRAALVVHLQRYPLAADTTEGMATCWIEQRSNDTLRFIEEVIVAMIDAGELMAQRLPDGRVLYRRGPGL